METAIAMVAKPPVPLNKMDGAIDDEQETHSTSRSRLMLSVPRSQ